MKHLLADAINRMPDRERLVLTLYYYEGLTLAEIGGVLGVTESRVCQIHTKAILQLRGRLGEPDRDTGARPLLTRRSGSPLGAGSPGTNDPAANCRSSTSPWQRRRSVRSQHFLRRFPVVVSSSDHGVAHALSLLAVARRRVRRSSSSLRRRSIVARARRDARPAGSARLAGVVAPSGRRPGRAPFDRARLGVRRRPPRRRLRRRAGHAGARRQRRAWSRFAGSVAGTLHVTIAHDGGLRTSYSFLASVAVHAGRRRRARRRRRHRPAATGDGTDATHGDGVLHFGLRVGDRYVDPMLLFRPARPHQARAPRARPSRPDETPVDAGRRAPRARRRRCSSRRPARTAVAPTRPTTACDSGVPLVGDVLDAACERRRRGSATAPTTRSTAGIAVPRTR